MFITTSELCGFGIGFGIGRKYRPITVSVSVSGRNQNGGFGRSLPQAAAQILSAMEEAAEEEIQGMSFMNFFIMWLCFYTYCIFALYAGARHDRNPDNYPNRRQVRQEYLEMIRRNIPSGRPW